ncbi:MAG: hypothetical protein ABIJ96_00210 [Elusimicrobiota bacterium]
MRLLRNRRGQLAIPSLFVLPSLFLFVYLIFETAKVSREKIRHQFAIDAAAFIEMTNYSDFLNRSAYVNGAFPQRIFEEGFYGTPIETKKNTSGTLPNNMGMAGDRLYEILYKNGAFPADPDEPAKASLDGRPSWFLKFKGPGAGGKNDSSPTLDPRLNLLTMDDALDYWISWDDAQDIYKLYVQIYQLLGSVEDAQYSVFCRLTGASGCPNSDGKHNFFRKSYWLNTNDPIDDAFDGAQAFNKYPFNPRPHCIQEIMIHGNKPTNNAFQPYQIWAPSDPVQMPKTIENCVEGDGLFQMESIDPGHLRAMAEPHEDSPWPGYPVVQHWDVEQSVLGSNYFNVNFHNMIRCQDGGGPCVHATVGLSNPSGPGKGLWPNPTPKFQTRLYP